LDEAQLEQVQRVLRDPPAAAGLVGNLWDGRTLSAYLDQRYGIALGVRQCQRLFRQFGFRLRKPRGLVAKADPELQEAHKKTQENGEKSRR
jgi:transposase